MIQRLTVSALVRNRSGVLLRVADFLRAADIIYEASPSPRPSIRSFRE